MEGEVVRDDQWERLKPFVLGGRKDRRGPRSDGRRFFDAILWLARSGARWRDLPEDRLGPYQTVKRRYYRWIDQGVFDWIFEAVAADPDMEWLSIDATVIRAQAQAAGGRRKRGTASPGSRQLPWRIWQQNPCCSGCPRAAGSFPSRPRTAEPHGSGLRPRSGTASTNRCSPTAPMMPTAYMTSSSIRPTSSAGASRVSSPSSNNGDASPHAMTNSQPISSASSSWQASCFGSNS